MLSGGDAVASARPTGLGETLSLVPRRLLPGVSADATTTTLETLANQLTSLRSGTKFDVYASYLRWANDAAQQLAQLVSDGDVTRLVLSPRHWAPVTIDPAANEALMSLVQLEIDQVRRRLEAARVELGEAVARWAGHQGQLVVADTNVYLHHRDEFVDIDWHAPLDLRSDGQVNLVLPLLVVDELDRHKRSQQRARAGNALRHVNELFSDPGSTVTLAPGPDKPVRMHLLLDRPGHVRLADADAELIDRCRALRAVAGRDVALVTFDTGIVLRTRAAGVTSCRLKDDAGPSGI